MLDKIKKYKLGEDKKKDFKIFLVIFSLYVLFGVVVKIRTGWYGVDSYVSTLYAFSYDVDGFVRRGLCGTIFNFFVNIFPALGCWKGLFYFIWALTILYFVSLILFCKWAFNKINNQTTYRIVYFIALFMLAFLIPTSCYHAGGFGRADSVQMMIVLIQVYLVMENKWVWLTIPLSGINTLFHEGYAIMNFNVIVALMIYKAITIKGGKNKAIYWISFVANLGIVAFIAIYSLKHSGAGTLEGYLHGLEYAGTLNSDGAVHHNLLNMMTGYYDQSITITTDDSILVREELNELPVFLTTFIPVFYLFIKFVVNMFISLKGKKHKVLYVALVIIGPALIAYQYKTYCDYGRYVWWIFFYYFAVCLALASQDDVVIEQAIARSFNYSNIKALACLLLAIIYQPLGTCFFTTLSRLIKKYLL